MIHSVSQPLTIHGTAAVPGVPSAALNHRASLSYLKKYYFALHRKFSGRPGAATPICCLPVFPCGSLISATSGPSSMLPSNETLSPSLMTHRHSSARLQTVLRFFRQACDHRSQHVLLRSTCRDSSSQSVTGVTWDSSRPGSTTGCTDPACVSVLLVEKIFFRTSQTILRQAWGRHSHLCCLPVFHRASFMSAISGPSGMLPSNEARSLSLVTHRQSSTRLQTILRFLQAGLGPQISVCFAQVSLR